MANTPIGIPATWEETKAAFEKAAQPAELPLPTREEKREYVRFFQIVFNLLPPSSNHIYMPTGRHGRMVLTKEAREYGERFSDHVRRTNGVEVSRLNPAGVFAVHIRFFFPNLLNSGWDNNVPSRRPLSRYKKLDLENRRKLLDDCIRDAIGIDDSLFLATSAEKHHDPKNPHVEIIIQEVDPTMFGM